MCVGVALARSEIPVRVWEKHALAEREYLRPAGGVGGGAAVVPGTGGGGSTGDSEVRFLWKARPAVLPVWRDGRMEVVAWGCKQRKSKLPFGGWTWELTIQAGGWANSGVELVDVPGTFIWAGGVWTRVRHGVRGLLVRGWEGPVVYVVCRPSSRYYRVMTGVEFQPVLIGEVI